MRKFGLFNVAIPLSMGVALGQMVTLKGAIILIGLLLIIFAWTVVVLIFSKG